MLIYKIRDKLLASGLKQCPVRGTKREHGLVPEAASSGIAMASSRAASQLLIVEDELILAKRVARQLERQGYGIAGINTTGRAALEHFERCQPDLVLMNIALPGDWDGIETAARIRERAEISIIYLTAYASEVTLARAEATGGAYGYLTKPYQERDQHATVKMALTQHQMQQRECT